MSIKLIYFHDLRANDDVRIIFKMSMEGRKKKQTFKCFFFLYVQHWELFLHTSKHNLNSNTNQIKFIKIGDENGKIYLYFLNYKLFLYNGKIIQIGMIEFL